MNYFIIICNSTKRSFWPYSWGYFIIIGLFSIRAYLSTKFTEIKTTYFYKQMKKEKNNNKKQSLSEPLEKFKFNEVDFLLNPQIDNSDTNLEEEYESDNLNLSAQRFNGRFNKKSKKEQSQIIVYVPALLNQFQGGDVPIVQPTKILFTVMIVTRTQKIYIKITLCIFFILREECAIVVILVHLKHFVLNIQALSRTQKKLRNLLKNLLIKKKFVI